MKVGNSIVQNSCADRLDLPREFGGKRQCSPGARRWRRSWSRPQRSRCPRPATSYRRLFSYCRCAPALRPDPGARMPAGAELQTREALRGDLRRRPALTAACGAQCPVQYYNYARAGVHALSVAAYTFTRSPVCLAGPLLEVRGAARRARAAGQRLWRRQCAGYRVEADLLSGVYAW